ncbi:hypothetical protein [Actinomadura bangladeshensis]|uniref:Uncharacterized protein n=1 Tax=Actinomadura bangladeshensis TaxID=453573 RepID=A0A6L9QAT4_9ACTN|nr:hypothetical protein [Actinomadura bangladeshensis]NEA22188.1 hypothetical protein [Actinomadura bangladeshensis]
MNLHDRPQYVVRQLLDRYGLWFARYRGCLDLAIQEVGASWEPTIPDFDEVDGCVRAGDVRQRTATFIEKRWKAAGSPLKLRTVGFVGLHLYTPEGRRIRTRKFPRSARTGLKLPITPWPDVLFGEDPSADPFEVSILWEIDFKTKSLKDAHLAAIDWKENSSGTEILYYAEEIPPAASGGLGGPATTPSNGPTTPFRPSADDFDDFLNEADEEAGPDPA